MPPRRVAPPRGRMAAILFLAVAACAPTPPPRAGANGGAGANAPNPVVGAYTGSLVADGQTFSAHLRLRAAAPGRSTGILRVSPPVELEGDVTAVVMDDVMRIDVTYTSADGCEGRIVGILDVGRDGSGLEGPVTLTDCGEPVAGQILLRRRER